MNASSTSEIPQRRTPENLILQRTTSRDSRASAFSTISPLTPSTDSPISPDNWQGYIAQNQISHKPISRPSSSTSPSTMIGPASSYYDPEQALPQDAPDYQRWVDAYGNGQMGFGGQNVAALSQAQYQQHQRQAPQLQNQYQFVPNQYSPAPTSDHQYRPTQGMTRPTPPHTTRSPSSDYPPPVSGRTGLQSNYSQPIDSTMYFYQQPPMGGSQSTYNTFSGTQPAPAQQPQRQVATYSSPAADPSFTPTSDLHTLHSHQSVSPPWNEERLPQTQTPAQRPGPSAKRVQRPAASNATATTAKPQQPGSAKKSATGRKRPRRSGGDGDSDSESDEDPSIDARGGGEGQQPLTRLPGACTHCKKLKMKCDFPKNENVCKRCKGTNHQCIVEGRKPRTAPNKREYLLAQIRQKDAIIESLLKQIHNPYMATPLSIASYRMATSPSDQNNRNIIAWLDRLQASVRAGGTGGGEPAFKFESRSPTKADDDSDTESADGRDDDFEHVDADEVQTAKEAEAMQALPDSTVPLGLIANLSLSNSRANKASSQNGDLASTDTLDDDNVGVANETYFMPGPATDLGMRAMLIEQHSPPEILVHGLVAPEDVDKLFEIFFQRINCFISLLDPYLHTPASTFARCPFLFTVICAVASRYYPEKSEIYPIAMHFAKHAAANALIDGWKSVELCQAYILMSIYAVPARRWEEDRSWLYIGLAIRIATDLNLHQVSTTKPANERQEREMLNKTRVWLNCFNLDRSTATQFGKPSTIREDFVVRKGSDWYLQSQFNHKYDIHLCAYTAMLRIVAAFHDEVFSDPTTASGLNKTIDFRSVTLTHDANLTQYQDEWTKRFAEGSDPNDRGSAFRCTLLPFLTNYSRLVMFSFGFQQAYQRGFAPGDEVFFNKCFESAKAVIKNFIEVLAPSGYMRFSADGHFVFSSFASAFLLKLLRPEFSSMMTKELEVEIFDLIGRLITTFSSQEIAIDDRHTPKLYARFLTGLLARNRRDGGTIGRLHPQPPPQSEIAHAASGGYTSQTATSAPSFSITAPEGDTRSGLVGGYTHAVFNPAIETPDPPVYRPESTFDFGGPTDFTHLGLGGGSLGDFSGGEMLATMQALKSPQYWSTMMMPGFSWPQDSPMMNSTHEPDPIYSQNVPGLHYQEFGNYQPAHVLMN